MLAAWQCLAALSNRGIKATKPHCRCDFGRGSQEIPGSRHLSHQNHVRLSLVYADPCCTLYILKSGNDRHASSILSRSKSVHGYFFTTTSTTKPGTPQSRLKLGPQELLQVMKWEGPSFTGHIAWQDLVLRWAMMSLQKCRWPAGLLHKFRKVDRTDWVFPVVLRY